MERSRLISMAIVGASIVGFGLACGGRTSTESVELREAYDSGRVKVTVKAQDQGAKLEVQLREVLGKPLTVVVRKGETVLPLRMADYEMASFESKGGGGMGNPAALVLSAEREESARLSGSDPAFLSLRQGGETRLVSGSITTLTELNPTIAPCANRRGGVPRRDGGEAHIEPQELQDILSVKSQVVVVKGEDGKYYAFLGYVVMGVKERTVTFREGAALAVGCSDVAEPKDIATFLKNNLFEGSPYAVRADANTAVDVDRVITTFAVGTVK